MLCSIDIFPYMLVTTAKYVLPEICFSHRSHGLRSIKSSPVGGITDLVGPPELAKVGVPSSANFPVNFQHFFQPLRRTVEPEGQLKLSLSLFSWSINAIVADPTASGPSLLEICDLPCQRDLEMFFGDTGSQPIRISLYQVLKELRDILAFPARILDKKLSGLGKIFSWPWRKVQQNGDHQHDLHYYQPSHHHSLTICERMPHISDGKNSHVSPKAMTVSVKHRRGCRRHWWKTWKMTCWQKGWKQTQTFEAGPCRMFVQNTLCQFDKVNSVPVANLKMLILYRLHWLSIAGGETAGWQRMNAWLDTGLHTYKHTFRRLKGQMESARWNSQVGWTETV